MGRCVSSSEPSGIFGVRASWEFFFVLKLVLIAEEMCDARIKIFGELAFPQLSPSGEILLGQAFRKGTGGRENHALEDCWSHDN
jgi:hypothetical protein